MPSTSLTSSASYFSLQCCFEEKRALHAPKSRRLRTMNRESSRRCLHSTSPICVSDEKIFASTHEPSIFMEIARSIWMELLHYASPRRISKRPIRESRSRSDGNGRSVKLWRAKFHKASPSTGLMSLLRRHRCW